MNNILLAELTAVEKLGLGGNTMLLGLVMVFVVLGIIIGMVSLIKFVMGKVETMKSNKKEVKTAPVAPAPQVVAPVVSNNDEVVAAISAAISMYYDTEYAMTGKSVKFRVRSIKEIR